jgi:hypothetical protein
MVLEGGRENGWVGGVGREVWGVLLDRFAIDISEEVSYGAGQELPELVAMGVQDAVVVVVEEYEDVLAANRWRVHT